MEEQQGSSPVVGQVKMRGGRAGLWLLIAIVVVALAGAGWLWWQLMKSQKEVTSVKDQKAQLQKRIDEMTKKSSSGSSSDSAAAGDAAACDDTPTTTMKDNIKAALDSKNTAAFSTYTTNPVKYVVAASEFGRDLTPAEAASSLDYTHSATGPWDFSLPAATIAHYDAGFYTDYFDTNTYVGKSTDGMVIAFDFACGGKIKQIFVAANEDLL